MYQGMYEAPKGVMVFLGNRAQDLFGILIEEVS
jgi:hypothetical protein